MLGLVTVLVKLLIYIVLHYVMGVVYVGVPVHVPKVVIGYRCGLGDVADAWTWFGCWRSRCRPMEVEIIVDPCYIRKHLDWRSRCRLLFYIMHELCHWYLNTRNETVAEYCATVILAEHGYRQCALERAITTVWGWYLKPLFDTLNNCSRLMRKVIHALERLNIEKAEKLYRQLRLCIQSLEPRPDNPYVKGDFEFLMNGEGIPDNVKHMIRWYGDEIFAVGLRIYKKIMGNVLVKQA